MRRPILSLLITVVLVITPIGFADSTEAIKAKLVQLAEEYQGEGDPDFKIQNQLDPLVQQLLEANPQPPVKDRLNLLHGAWHQIWGPYDYRNDDRGVDLKTSPNHIYQVIFPGGFYYNVSPIKEGKALEETRVTLLKGEYKLDPNRPNDLQVKFVEYPGNLGWDGTGNVWQTSILAAQDAIPNKITIVPWWIVWLFFDGGNLREVYTDEDLRIVYATNNKNFKKDYLYIMRRVATAADLKTSAGNK